MLDVPNSERKRSSELDEELDDEEDDSDDSDSDDEDYVVDIISSDEEAELEAQRIGLDELISRTLLQPLNASGERSRSTGQSAGCSRDSLQQQKDELHQLLPNEQREQPIQVLPQQQQQADQQNGEQQKKQWQQQQPTDGKQKEISNCAKKQQAPREKGKHKHHKERGQPKDLEESQEQGLHQRLQQNLQKAHQQFQKLQQVWKGKTPKERHVPKSTNKSKSKSAAEPRKRGHQLKPAVAQEQNEPDQQNQPDVQPELQLKPHKEVEPELQQVQHNHAELTLFENDNQQERWAKPKPVLSPPRVSRAKPSLKKRAINVDRPRLGVAQTQIQLVAAAQSQTTQKSLVISSGSKEELPAEQLSKSEVTLKQIRLFQNEQTQEIQVPVAIPEGASKGDSLPEELQERENKKREAVQTQQAKQVISACEAQDLHEHKLILRETKSEQEDAVPQQPLLTVEMNLQHQHENKQLPTEDSPKNEKQTRQVISAKLTSRSANPPRKPLKKRLQSLMTMFAEQESSRSTEESPVEELPKLEVTQAEIQIVENEQPQDIKKQPLVVSSCPREDLPAAELPKLEETQTQIQLFEDEQTQELHGSVVKPSVPKSEPPPEELQEGDCKKRPVERSQQSEQVVSVCEEQAMPEQTLALQKAKSKEQESEPQQQLPTVEMNLQHQHENKQLPSEDPSENEKQTRQEIPRSVVISNGKPLKKRIRSLMAIIEKQRQKQELLQKEQEQKQVQILLPEDTQQVIQQERQQQLEHEDQPQHEHKIQKDQDQQVLCTEASPTQQKFEQEDQLKQQKIQKQHEQQVFNPEDSLSQQECQNVYLLEQVLDQMDQLGQHNLQNDHGQELVQPVENLTQQVLHQEDKPQQHGLQKEHEQKALLQPEDSLTQPALDQEDQPQQTELQKIHDQQVLPQPQDKLTQPERQPQQVVDQQDQKQEQTTPQKDRDEQETPKDQKQPPPLLPVEADRTPPPIEEQQLHHERASASSKHSSLASTLTPSSPVTSDFEHGGNIFVSAGQNALFFNCSSCDSRYCDWEVFRAHLLDGHNLIKKKAGRPRKSAPHKPLRQSASPSVDVKQEKEQNTLPPSTVVPLESCGHISIHKRKDIYFICNCESSHSQLEEFHKHLNEQHEYFNEGSSRKRQLPLPKIEVKNESDIRTETMSSTARELSAAMETTTTTTLASATAPPTPSPPLLLSPRSPPATEQPKQNPVIVVIHTTVGLSSSNKQMTPSEAPETPPPEEEIFEKQKQHIMVDSSVQAGNDSEQESEVAEQLVEVQFEEEINNLSSQVDHQQKPSIKPQPPQPQQQQQQQQHEGGDTEQQMPQPAKLEAECSVGSLVAKAVENIVSRRGRKRKADATTIASTTTRSKRHSPAKRARKKVVAPAEPKVIAPSEPKVIAPSEPKVIAPAKPKVTVTPATEPKLSARARRKSYKDFFDEKPSISPESTASNKVKTAACKRGRSRVTFAPSTDRESSLESSSFTDVSEHLPKRNRRGRRPKKRDDQDSEQPRFACSQCPKSFEKLSRLTEHERLHTGEKPFLCGDCGKSFRIKMRLNEHQLRHRKDKAFKCDICGLGVATRQDLVLHQRHHQKDRRYQCTDCPKAFVRSSDLKIHLRVHTGEKPYPCKVCGKCFRANQNLIVHRRSHVGEKNYKCDYCDKRFMRNIDRKVHHRTHTGDKPFKCHICSRGYSSRVHVRAHLEREHINSGVPRERKRPGPKPKAKTQPAAVEMLQHIKSDAGEATNQPETTNGGRRKQQQQQASRRRTRTSTATITNVQQQQLQQQVQPEIIVFEIIEKVEEDNHNPPTPPKPPPLPPPQQVSVIVSMQVENVAAVDEPMPEKENDTLLLVGRPGSASAKRVSVAAPREKKERKINSYFTVVGKKTET